MSFQQDPAIASALESWRLREVERDWNGVLAQAGLLSSSARGPQSRARRRLPVTRRRLLVGVVAAAIVLSAPALAIVTGAIRWPSESRPGALLGASPAGSGVTVILRSHGSLLVRRHGSIRFFIPREKKPGRVFTWRLSAKTGSVAEASIRLQSGLVVKLCAPCQGDGSGRFIVRGNRALDFFNGRAVLKVVADGHRTSAPIILRSLR